MSLKNNLNIHSESENICSKIIFMKTHELITKEIKMGFFISYITKKVFLKYGKQEIK
jgi:hypothetical protein